MYRADRLTAVLGLLVLSLALGASGLHANHVTQESSAGSECATCLLAQTLFTIAPGESLPTAPAAESESGPREPSARVGVPAHVELETTRGPPHDG